MAALAACSRPAAPPETTGVLQVGVRNSPTTYFMAHNGEPAGLNMICWWRLPSRKLVG